MLKKYITTVFLAMAIISIVIIAEVMFVLNNRPDITAPIFLWTAKKMATYNSAASIYLLEKTAIEYSKITHEPSQSYVELFKGFGGNKVKMHPDFLENYSRYVSGLDQQLNLSEHLDKVAFMYYKIGIFAYYGNEQELAADFLNASVHIYPKSGYNHIEYANIYLQYHDFHKAKAILEKCYKYEHARDWCEVYRDGNLHINEGEPVGFTEMYIEKEF